MLRHLVSVALLTCSASGETCFVKMEKPLKEPPFSAENEAELFQHFSANINLNGTGAVIASPGACPALAECCNINDPQPYGFHWTRDASLSLLTYLEHAKQVPKLDGEASLLQTNRQGLKGSRKDVVESTVEAFASWVEKAHERKVPAHNLGGEVSAEQEAYLEPKWTFDGEPYKGGWCRPQTDGPALRARTMMRAAKAFPSIKERFWSLAKKDLDWLVENYAMNSCDLWEETRDDDFVWNRVTQLAALAEGIEFTEDEALKKTYLEAMKQKGEPLANHIAKDEQGGEYITNCPATNMGEDCVRYDKALDGVLMLTLIHGRAMVPTENFKLPSFLDAQVANTVREVSRVFCESYPINQQDSEANVPGVLLGRYAKDHYGHQSQGNPWVLITSALANLLYKAAVEVQQGGTASPAWEQVFKDPGFSGSAADFVAAGDSVLMRLKNHMDQGMRLYEQMDKTTGNQWNAKDLTWSYAETLDAIRARREAMECSECS